MPRLSPSLLRHAAARHKHLFRLLRECRDLESASNELRWLAEHANQKVDSKHCISAEARLSGYVRRRSRGEPLQYILGNQPFGSLDILCRNRVLIPRPETELYTTTLATLLTELRRGGVIDGARPLNVVDLCTGTGCISLLLHALLQPTSSNSDGGQALSILAADVSPHALRLARHNLGHNINMGLLRPSCHYDILFESLDVLQLGRVADESKASEIGVAEKSAPRITSFLNQEWDVIISNPPYISPADYAPGGTVSGSVRRYEPKLALVPPPMHGPTTDRDVCQADQFYEAVLQTARRVGANLVVMEIGDSQQASRVRQLVPRIITGEMLVETWRDDGVAIDHSSARKAESSAEEAGAAPERAVVVWRNTWMNWRRDGTQRCAL